ncbi:SAICAR synthetase/ADE2 N-terminal [Trinorchestia longiramus]|nr:SAICAR synthetase/ADE2 N-terminal [Trinorchestia longiramus]
MADAKESAAGPIKAELLSEGKTKQIYAVKDDPHHVIVVNKDRITAHNAQIAHDLEGKAECSNATNAKIFTYLNTAGVKTSFRRLLDESSYLARRCRMVPIEWVTRRIATGSFLKRNPGVEEGFRFSPLKLETFFKDDAANDPEWSKAQVLSISLPELDGPVKEWQYNSMASATIAVFEMLERAWAAQRCTLVDMKIEFGVDVETGEILLSDVIDNDSWRLWENGKKELMKDKQVYRNLKDFSVEDMKRVKVNYTWVKDKLDGFTDGPQNTVVLLMGSASDAAVGDDIKKHCEKLHLKLDRRIMSAHKVTEQTLNTVRYYNSLPTPVVYIAVAGRSNGLGPVVSGNTTLPVINCPPVKKQEQTHDVWSSLSVPSGLGCSTVIYPETAALHAASIFGLTDHRVWSRLRGLQLQRELALQKADLTLQEQDVL